MIYGTVLPYFICNFVLQSAGPRHMPLLPIRSNNELLPLYCAGRFHYLFFMLNLVTPTSKVSRIICCTRVSKWFEILYICYQAQGWHIVDNQKDKLKTQAKTDATSVISYFLNQTHYRTSYSHILNKNLNVDVHFSNFVRGK